MECYFVAKSNDAVRIVAMLGNSGMVADKGTYPASTITYLIFGTMLSIWLSDRNIKLCGEPSAPT